MADPEPESPATTCARPADPRPTATRPVSPPIHLSSVYEVADLAQVDAIYEGRESGYIYARDAHPNSAQLAAKVAAIEGAEAALVCGSGMAAEAAIFLGHLDAGDHVALSAGLYGRTVGLVGRELARFGVEHSTFDASRPETLNGAIQRKTKLAFVESISNPLMRVADVAGLAGIAHAAGILLAVDHTFAPLLSRPLAMGADLVVHSATKLIGGHSDVTLGLVVGRKPTIDRLANLASTFGLTGNPFDSWLALRGLSTLALRVRQTSINALELARRLEAHPAVGSVLYPGLASHPDHALAAQIFADGFGAMMSFDLGTRDRADAFIRSLKHIPYAPSLGDVSTTLSHPTTTSHRFQSPEEWARQGITPGLIRLSVGVEDVE
ncbi:MAG TPA: aminotransferase class I/II-fold pyridoxal phosphate-dependent enzyme, partial [Isosphaeraceae bacterium]